MNGKWRTWAERDLRPTVMNSEHAAYIRGKQLYTFRQLLPFGLTASALNALVLVIYLGLHDPSPALLFWGTLMTSLAFVGARSVYYVVRHKSPPRPRTQKELYRPVAESAVLGLAWALCPVLFVPTTQGMELAAVLWVCAGMMTGAAYVLSTLPAAAIPFVTALSFGMAIGIMRSGSGTEQMILLLVLAVHTGVMIRTTFWNYQNHVRSWLQRSMLSDQADQLEKKKQVISLLLNEFEEAASDCLWETDAQHRITRPSKYLAERSGFKQEQLDQQPLIGFFDADHPDAKEDYERLRTAMAQHQPVHNLCLAVRRPTRVEWWRISAKPVFDEAGTFEGFRGVAADITDKRLADQRVAYLAHYDALTGVPKQETLREALNAAVSSFGAGTAPFAVHCLDLDRFKTINDVHGHAVGDAVLQSAARRIQSVIGPKDIVARFGGDEFVVLQQGISGPGEAMALALTIQDLMSVPVETDTALVQSTVSIGIALFPDQAVTAVDLMRYADLALMAAKEGGRDSSRLFEPEMNDAVSQRTRMEADLRNALAKNEFVLNYQPIVDAHTGEVGGYETLIRWQHPDRGSVSPTEFVPILEQTGLIWQVGNWVIREALREAATWDPSLKVSINLSPMQVKNRSLLTIITHTLAQTGVDPRRVDFEITETALFDTTEDSLSVMHALRDLGASISLDDFGTGYSSLSYLRAFPFTKIKIDKSFVDQMETSDECAAIIQAVLGLAGRLGMRTTAEGVESAEQARKLTEGGCAELQGYHFGRPGLPSELVAAGLLQLAPAPREPAKPVHPFARPLAKVS